MVLLQAEDENTKHETSGCAKRLVQVSPSIPPGCRITCIYIVIRMVIYPQHSSRPINNSPGDNSMAGRGAKAVAVVETIPSYQNRLRWTNSMNDNYCFSEPNNQEQVNNIGPLYSRFSKNVFSENVVIHVPFAQMSTML